MKRSKILREVTEMLEASGVPHRIVDGTAHVKVYVGDRMVQVVPRCPGRESQRGDLNMRAAIRRAIREHTK